MIKLTPLVKATKPLVQTPSKLEAPVTISDQEFKENFGQGQYSPINQDASGGGEATVQPTYYDRRNGMKGGFLAKRN